MTDRFEEWRLETWGTADGYEQKFVIGTNVIGVLRGSDPYLQDQYVILSAHYDHLGKAPGGKFSPGAVDNASGIAVLLRVAAELAASEEKPRRSIVFAAFDAEESGMLGAFAFTCREDFDPTALAGLVNLDMLGRRFLDISENVLLSVGTERFPRLRDVVREAGEQAGLEVLPLGRDLALGRSDHAAFETYGAPWVFFTSGPYADYHQVTDTPEKIDYDLLRRTAEVVTSSLLALANAELVEPEVNVQEGDREELRSLYRLSQDIVRSEEESQIAPAERLQQVRFLQERAARLLAAPSYSLAERDLFVEEVMEALAPLLMGKEIGPDERTALAVILELYRHHPQLLAEGMRTMLRHVQKHPPGILRGAPPFHHLAFEVSDASVILTEMPGDRIELSYNIPVFNARARFRSFGRGDLEIDGMWHVNNIVGTRDEVVDSLLLMWRQEEFPPEHSAVAGALLQRVSGTDFGDRYATWLAWRLAKTGQPDEPALFLDLAQRAKGNVRKRALAFSLQQDQAVALPLLMAAIRDPAEEAGVQAWAMEHLPAAAGPDGWALLVGQLNNPAILARQPFVLSETFPFYNRTIIRWARQQVKPHPHITPPKSLGDVALEQLARATGKNFGKHPHAWREWLKQTPAATGETAKPLTADAF
jgi:hypothetical protein